MAAFPLPVAILDDLISVSWLTEMRSSRWPEAERPPFSTIHHQRDPNNLPVFWMTSVGRPDSLKNVLQMSASPMTHHDLVTHVSQRTQMLLWNTFWWRLLHSFWFFGKHLIVSLTQALSKWLSELPVCYYAEVISLHVSTPCPMGNCYPWDMVLASASTYSTFFFFFLTALFNIRELLYSTVS